MADTFSRVVALEAKQVALEGSVHSLDKRVDDLTKTHDKHDRALFGWSDENGETHDGIVQHVADIRRFASVCVNLLGKLIPAVWTGTLTAIGALIAYAARSAWTAWIAAQAAPHH